MPRKKKGATDAVEIMHRRFFKGKPEMRTTRGIHWPFCIGLRRRSTSAWKFDLSPHMRRAKVTNGDGTRSHDRRHSTMFRQRPEHLRSVAPTHFAFPVRAASLVGPKPTFHSDSQRTSSLVNFNLMVATNGVSEKQSL